MLISEREIVISRETCNLNILSHIIFEMQGKLNSDEIPIRFVITRTTKKNYYCELGTISQIDKNCLPTSIFDLNRRKCENTDKFNAVLLIPTGIGAVLGGHSGDGGALARLIASSCDTLITHPNVVNAADINELPENGLYVEGSIITQLLMGTVGLQKIRSNRVLIILGEHEEKSFREMAINSISAARVTLGLNPLIVKIEDDILMKALYSKSGRAIGRIEHFENLCNILDNYCSEYDAVALSTLIDVPKRFHKDYFKEENAEMVNPWGGVEAMLTHAVSLLYNVPSAHSPMITSDEIMNLDVGVVDPRKAAEAVSMTYLHCILKGLHKSPRIIRKDFCGHFGIISAPDISCIITPDKCLGLPMLAAIEQGIPVIAVKENKNQMKNKLEDLPFKPSKLFVVDNYWEAVGIMQALKSGVSPETVRRPLSKTRVINGVGF